MRLFALFALLVAGVVDVWSQPAIASRSARPRNPTIAILPFVNANQEASRDGLGVSLAAMFGTHLKNETSFMVLERSQIARIVGEQGLEASGLTESQRLQLGRLLQVEVILAGEVSRFGGLVQMDARLVSVQTGQVLVAEYAAIDGYAKLRESVVSISKALEMKYLRRWMGDVVVSVQPVDAEVYLDDQYAGKASLKEPLRIPNLMEGRYALRVLAAGYATVTDTVGVVPRGVREVPVALKALPGALRLASEPVGARVLVNGKDVGASPAILDTLQEGRYHVAFQLNGFRLHERDVEVRSGQRSEVKAVLEVLPGRVSVGSVPKGAEVWLDDKRVGYAPMLVENVVPGPHAIRLEAPGRSPVRDAVIVKPGEEVAWGGTLEPLRGTLTVVPQTDSVGVRIFQAGRGLVATLPAPFHKREMEIGDWTLEFSRPQHDTVVVKANVATQRETRLEPRLRERTAHLEVRTTGNPAEVWVDGRYVGRTGRAVAELAKGGHEVAWSSYFHQGSDSVRVAPDEHRVVEIPPPGRVRARWMVPLGLILSTLLLFAAGR